MYLAVKVNLAANFSTIPWGTTLSGYIKKGVDETLCTSTEIKTRDELKAS